MLLDAAGVNCAASRPANYDTPPLPNASRRPGEWVARYVRRMHPEGERGALDYAALTHFHGDHMGTLLPEAPRSKSGAYQLNFRYFNGGDMAGFLASPNSPAWADMGVASRQGHLLVRVDADGAAYRVIVLDDSREDNAVRSVHGPYSSRGATEGLPR